MAPSAVANPAPEQAYPEDTPLPAELQPEAKPPEPVGPRLIGTAPLKALHTALSRELGTAGTREEKLALLSAIVGHPVESSKALTRAEGYAALDFLARVPTGEAHWEMDPSTGAITVTET